MVGNGILSRFNKHELIEKGWSHDKKYCVTSANGEKFLLRISPAAKHDNRKLLFEMQKQVAALEIAICTPIEFGTCDEGVYSIQSWIEGEDLGDILPTMPKQEQYALGLISGKFLKKIHSIPAPQSQDDWAARFNLKADTIIQKYKDCCLRFKGDDYMLEYLAQNRHLLDNRPQCFQHGDYHIGNMMLENGRLLVIDFDRYDFGDPWEEFNRIVWSASASPQFAYAQLRGYFGGDPPMDFFKLLAFYLASNTLASIYWAMPYGQADVDIMMRQSQVVLGWYDNMQNPVPLWFRRLT